MDKCRSGFRKWVKTKFEGDVTIPRVTFWMVCIMWWLAGIIHGFLAAPMTHGVMIACNNGNSENHYEGEPEEKTE